MEAQETVMGVGWVVAIMMFAGFVGGTVNYALGRTEKSTTTDWAWSVVIGTGASFLMPLFLSTLSSTLLSDLLTEGRGSPSDPFVFAGFCLLGAISSRAMIQTLTDRVLKEAKEARREVSELEDAVAPILDRETESDDEDDLSAARSAGVDLEPDLEQALRALTHERFSLRSVSGIAKDSGLDRTATKAALSSLADLGLASEVQGKKGSRWALTPAGRRRVGPL